MNVAKRLHALILKGAILASIALFWLFGVAISNVSLAPTHAASAKHGHGKRPVTVWKFVQRNAHGHAVLILNETAIKYTFVDQNVSWIASAPTWNVCIYNCKLNRGTLRPLSYVLGRIDNKVDYGKTHVVSKSKQTFEGRPATKVSYSVTSADPVKEKVEMMYQTGSERASSFSKGEQLFSDWIKTTPQVQLVLNGLTRISSTRGVLLEETRLYTGGRRHVVLSTDSVSQCQVSSSEFDYPTGFKDSTMTEIMDEKEKARQMSGVFEELLFDPAPANGKKEGSKRK